MVLLGPRASLLVALSLLASAATASAECAWVLWHTISSTSGPQVSSTNPGDAYTTKDACDRARKQIEESIAATTRRLELERPLRTTSDAHYLVCLPDTVDPRGPKGK